MKNYNLIDEAELPDIKNENSAEQEDQESNDSAEEEIQLKKCDYTKRSTN